MKNSIVTRVVFVISELNIGGTERQLAQLATRLPRQHLQVTVVSLYGSGPVAEEIRSAGIPVVVLARCVSTRVPRMIRNAVLVGIAFLSLYGYLRRIRPTIMHAFLYSAYIPATFAAKLAGVPVVITSRRSTGFFKENRSFVRLVERFANQLTDLIIPNSAAVMKSVQDQEHVPTHKLRVVRNGVEAPRAMQSREEVRTLLGVPNDAPCALAVANLIRYKGHEFLFRALSLVRNSGLSVHLLLVGDGPERRPLEVLAQQLDILSFVHFCGSQPDVGSFIAAADFGVLASQDEGLSNAVLEMMSAGLPVVATAVGGNPEAIRDSRDGLLVPPSEVGPLASAMIRLATDGALRARLGANAAGRTARDYTYERLVQEMSAIYLSFSGFR